MMQRRHFVFLLTILSQLTTAAIAAETIDFGNLLGQMLDRCNR